MNILEALLYLINNRRQGQQPFGGPSYFPVTTGYGTAANQQSLGWMMELARADRQRELERQRTEQILMDNAPLVRDRYLWDTRGGRDLGVGWGP